MRISSIFVPFFALIAGMCGFILRWMELLHAFDWRTGLPERGAPQTIGLIALSCVVMLVAFLFSLRIASKHKSPNGFENAFGSDSLSYPMIFTLIGLVWLGATVKRFFELRAVGAIPQIELIFLVGSVLAAISVTLFAIEMYQDPRRKLIFALSIVPTLFMCFWLIYLYKQNASNPILLRYCYQCLAIIASALGFYFTSGFVYFKPSPGKSVFTYLVAIYFCFVSLADGLEISIRLIFAALITINVLYLSMLLRNLRWNKAAA